MFKKSYLIVGVFMALVISLTGCIGAGKISPVSPPAKEGYFPTLTGIDLFGEQRIVPDDFKGNLHLVAVAFEREHQDPVNTWIPVAKELSAQNPGLTFYEIPLIYKINAAYRTWVNNGMRSGIPSDEGRERTITVYTDREKFLDITGMKADRIYLLLMTHEGKILWQTEGAYGESKLTSLKAALSQAVRQ